MVTNAHTPRQEKELAPSLTAVHPQVHHDSCTSISYRLLFYLRINNSDQYFVSDMCQAQAHAEQQQRGRKALGRHGGDNSPWLAQSRIYHCARVCTLVGSFTSRTAIITLILSLKVHGFRLLPASLSSIVHWLLTLLFEVEEKDRNSYAFLPDYW